MPEVTCDTSSTKNKAIETVYNGYRFRSRLEARWAVYFDSIGLEYEYEPEGYSIHGQYYLPDFWIPSAKAFVEIKPKIETPDLLYREFTNVVGKAIILVNGSPWDYSGHFYGWMTNDSGGGVFDSECLIGYVVPLRQDLVIIEEGTFINPETGQRSKEFAYNPYRYVAAIAVNYTRKGKDASIFVSQWETSKIVFDMDEIQGCQEWNEVIDNSRWIGADEILRSKRARFEHGEKPSVLGG